MPTITRITTTTTTARIAPTRTLPSRVSPNSGLILPTDAPGLQIGVRFASRPYGVVRVHAHGCACGSYTLMEAHGDYL